MYVWQWKKQQFLVLIPCCYFFWLFAFGQAYIHKYIQLQHNSWSIQLNQRNELCLVVGTTCRTYFNYHNIAYVTNRMTQLITVAVKHFVSIVIYTLIELLHCCCHFLFQWKYKIYKEIPWYRLAYLEYIYNMYSVCEPSIHPHFDQVSVCGRVLRSAKLYMRSVYNNIMIQFTVLGKTPIAALLLTAKPNLNYNLFIYFFFVHGKCARDLSKTINLYFMRSTSIYHPLGSA